MIDWHLLRVREAIWMSPSRMLFCAHLCAATCATPPAPMMRTLRFIDKSPRSGQTVDVIVEGKFAYDTQGAIGFLQYDRWHVYAVEPILLNHGVARRIADRDPVAHL